MGLRQKKQYGDNNPILYNQSTGLRDIFSTDSLFKGALLYKDTFWANTKFLLSVLINPLSHEVYILSGTLTEFRATLPSHYLGINEVNVNFPR